MENFSKKYAEVQLLLIQLEKAAVSYEDDSEQIQSDSQELISIFSKTFDAFCDLISEYLTLHHKSFSPSKSPREVIENAHKAGFLAEHDTQILLKGHEDQNKSIPMDGENPLIHNLETYAQTMQTIISEMKP